MEREVINGHKSRSFNSIPLLHYYIQMVVIFLTVLTGCMNIPQLEVEVEDVNDEISLPARDSAASKIGYAGMFNSQVSTEGAWTVYTAGGITVRDVAIQDEFVWCAGQGGIVRWNTRDMTYTIFTSIHGPGNNWVQTIAVGSDGDVWIGTYNGGISRFDGHTWETFNEADGINVSCINALAVDKNGIVWAGTSNGVYYYDDDQWIKFTQNYTLSTDFIRSIAFAPDGAIWFGGAENGVFRYDGEGIINFTTDDGLADNNVISLAVDSDGVVWALTSVTSLSRYVDGTWEVLARGAGPRPGVMTRGSLAVDHDGVVFAGTKKGMFRYDGETVESFKTDDPDAPETAAIFVIGDDGTIWAGSYTGGLHRFDGEEWERFTTHDWLPSNIIYDIAVDLEGIIWVASGNGLSQYDGIEAITYTSENSPLRGSVTSVAIGTKNEVWVGTYYGAYCYHEGTWELFTTGDGLRHNWVTALTVGSDGMVWAGTTEQTKDVFAFGISRYNGTTWESFTIEGWSPYADWKYISSITVDSKGVMWCGGNGGMSRYDGVTWKSFNSYTEEGFINNNVLSLTVDDNDELWIGHQNGLTRFDGETWEMYFKEIGLLEGHSTNLVCSVFRDANGAIWTVTKSADKKSGIYRFNGVEWETITLSDVLDYSDIYCAVNGLHNEIWIGTNCGLYCFDPEQFYPTPIFVAHAKITQNESVLDTNFPNPFNPATSIRFTLPHDGVVELSIYNIMGHKVATLYNGYYQAGSHTIDWDATGCANGVYFTVIKALGNTKIEKMMLVR